MKFKSRLAQGCCCSLAIGMLLACASQANAQLTISAVSGNGGNSAACPNGDFVEILNVSCATVNLDDYSVQVASSTGTVWTVVNLPAFNLAPGQYFAVRLETTATGVAYTGDFTASPSATSMSSTSGKAAIVLGNTALVGACPTAGMPIIDFVRYQVEATATTVCTEGFVANSTGVSTTNGGGMKRLGEGCTDTNVNRSDFVAVPSTLLPRNSSSPTNVCNPPASPNWGSCNFPTSCLVLTEGQCDTAGGSYGGDCTNCPLPGACCQPNGTCTLLIQIACEALGVGAVFRGDPSCPPANPCAESGKCCSADGTTCTQLVEVACLAPNVWSPGTCTISYQVNTDCPPNFTDIDPTGTELLGWTSVDDSAVAVALPFTFKFYGVDRTSISVGTNGYIVFLPPAGGTAASIPPDAPLSGTQQNNSAYVYGEDLHLRGTTADPIASVKTQVFGSSPDQIFIVQWTNVDLFSPTQPDGQRNTFQIKLYESSGVVEMQYLSLNLTGLSPIPNDVVIGVRETNANFTEVSESVVGVGPKALIFAPTGGCSQFLATGSCCIPNQPCSVLNEAACQLACGVYQGDGSNCTSAPCVTEACCLPQGGCQDALVAACVQAGGVAQGPGSNCGSANCPPAGRCCTATGACSVSLQATCQAAGSTWVANETCASLPCVVGACCASDGSCSQLTEAGCTNANGIRWTAATACTPNLCSGRCCAPDGTCSITAFNACVAPNTYGGDGTNCTGTPCQGSCCDSVSGNCTLTGPADCLVANQVFGGLGSSCSSANCSGRCCQPNGSCSVTGSVGCVGGTYTAGFDCTAVIVNTFDNIGLTIPDSPAPAVTNVQVLAGLPTPMTDVDVDFFIPHTFFADLVISVEHNGTIVALTDGTAACFGDDPNVVLDDEGTGGAMDTIACPSGIVPSSPPNYTPLQPLSAFDGMDPNGPWTISIRDDAGLDTGTLVRWSLHISTNAPVCTVVGCSCFGDMNGSGGVNGADVILFAQCAAAGGAGCPCGDMDHSGSVTSADVPLFVTSLLTGTCGAP